MLTPGYVDVVTVRGDRTAPTGETTVVRLLGLLPAQWSYDPEVDTDRIRLRIGLAGPTDSDAVDRAVSRALADATLRGWARAG